LAGTPINSHSFISQGETAMLNEPRERQFRIVFAFIEIACGLVTLITVGQVYPAWGAQFLRYKILWQIQRRKERTGK
jgi:hypothetical protein